MRTLLSLFLFAALASAQPRRIISGAPSVTEILFALGLGARVTGVTQFCNYPEAARSKPRIGGYLKPDLETVLALRPDLVILQRNPTDSAGRLRSAGLNVLEVEHESIRQIPEAILKIGQAAGVTDTARKLAAQIERDLASIRARMTGRPRPSLMFVVGRSPGTLDGIIVTGRASYLNEIIDAAGGRNAFADSKTAYPKVPLEEILARNPDVIIDMGEMAVTRGVTEEQKRGVIRLWQRRSELNAVKNGRVHAVASDIYVVPGPRVVEAAKAFARMLHPELQL